MQKQRLLTALTFILTMFLGGTAFASDNSEVVGQWDLALEVQGQAVNLDLNIVESTDGLVGTLGSEQGEGPLTDVQFDGETLTYNSDDGQGGSLATSLKLEDGMLKGNVTTPMGDLPATATKVS